MNSYYGKCNTCGREVPNTDPRMGSFCHAEIKEIFPPEKEGDKDIVRTKTCRGVIVRMGKAAQ